MSVIILKLSFSIFFSADIFDTLDGTLEDDGVTCECLGGGEMQHDPERKSIHIFGRSQVNIILY